MAAEMMEFDGSSWGNIHGIAPRLRKQKKSANIHHKAAAQRGLFHMQFFIRWDNAYFSNVERKIYNVASILFARLFSKYCPPIKPWRKHYVLKRKKIIIAKCISLLSGCKTIQTTVFLTFGFCHQVPIRT